VGDLTYIATEKAGCFWL